LTAISLSGVFMGLLIGASLMGRETKNRTLHVALCRPITKTQFILGKFMGLAQVLILNWVILSSVYLTMLAFFFDGISSAPIISSTLLVALILSLVQSFLIASWALLFSTISTTSVSVVLAVGIYLVGSNITQLRLVAARTQSESGQQLLRMIATLLPNFEFFQLGTKVIYGIPLSYGFILQSVLYGGIMMLVILALTGRLLQIREG
jgi:Cu-processing system permease protein